MFRRYSIYFTPATDSAFAQFGASWLGWDSATGTTVAHPDSALDIAALTERPRKYGFHATIKAPFHLAAGLNQNALETALADLCSRTAPATVRSLKLIQLGRFIALVPEGDVARLNDLAATIVTQLDNFRAPLTDTELSRRRASRLSARQEELLQEWGYPYVLDHFRFHMTLTGPIARELRDAVKTELSGLLTGIPIAPFKIDAMTLMGEDATGLFHQVIRFPLKG